MKKTTFIILFLLISTFVHAQWVDGTNIYNTNAGSVTIGATAPYTINASSALFPSVIPKLEIITGTGGTIPFAELITIRHPGATSDAISRQLGMVFKLSSESDIVQSNKMGGLIVESAKGSANSPTMSLVTANIRRLTIDQSGKIGIGTTTPSFPFQLYNTTARSTNSGSSAEFGFESFASTTAFQGSRLYFGRSRGTSTAPLAAQSGDYLGYLDFFGHDGTTVQRSGQLIFQVDGVPSSGIVPGVFRIITAGADGVNTERMRINSAGNVGIAATAPISTFQVSNGAYKFSAGRAPGADLNYGTSYIGFNAARIGTAVSANWTIEGDGAHNGGGVIYSDIFGTVSIAPIASAGGGAQTLADLDIKSKIAFRVSGTGNVGIGTTDNSAWNLSGSTYKLAVGGGIIATAVTVKAVPNWPDYVFKDGYKLLSLPDVKNYIDQNHHLPEIPSAQQIEKDGVNVGEMNKLLLKKIEELTLYLIEKDKKEKEQEERISRLEKVIQNSACNR
ncbi:hypothetical protein [Mucilaginibacter endophyticus]|uniref:hypothetical protein n=1 Tax=Mucilaginibacter endophyticus TaxID=2675003 RepID=UPI000E0DAEF8|nr:hypothetical protein [Mucilaginibacter endophyticus]